MQHASQVFWHLLFTPSFLHLPFFFSLAQFFALSMHVPGGAGAGVGFGLGGVGFGVGVGFGLGGVGFGVGVAPVVPTKSSKLGEEDLESRTTFGVAAVDSSSPTVLALLLELFFEDQSCRPSYVWTGHRSAAHCSFSCIAAVAG